MQSAFFFFFSAKLREQYQVLLAHSLVHFHHQLGANIAIWKQLFDAGGNRVDESTETQPIKELNRYVLALFGINTLQSHLTEH